VGWVDAELVVVALAAMLSPTTLTFSVFSLVMGERPLRTGIWFYAGALGITLVIGIAAAFVLGNAAASPKPSTPKTWVSILDIVLAVVLLAWVWHARRRTLDPAKTQAALDKMSAVASSPWIAVVAAGATLANPGAFIPIALKTISETDPGAAGYAVDWVFFALVSLLPLLVAIVLLVVARDWALRVLRGARDWLEVHAFTVALVLVALLAASLLRGGISGLVG
jgi:Sap-like sulfolipid-1-addressing protein